MKRALPLALFLAASAAQGAPFADPFRPPREAQAPAEGAGAEKKVLTSRLESVLIAPDRRVAVIDGHQYLEGERIGNGRVLRISETEVVIRHSDRDEKLALFPDNAKRTSAAPKGRK